MEKAEIIMIGNLKGGAGKSTLCVSLSTALEALGYKCCLIDADPEGNLTNNLLADNPDYILYDLLQMKLDADDFRKAIVHTAAGDLIPTTEVKVETKSTKKGMFMQPASKSLHRTIEDMAKDTDGDLWLASILYQTEIRDIYDFIIIDTPGHANKILDNAFIACNSILIPCDIDPDAMNGLNNLLSSFVPQFSRRETVKSNDYFDGYEETVSFDGIALMKFSDKTKGERDIIDDITQFAKTNDFYIYGTTYTHTRSALLTSKKTHCSILDLMYSSPAPTDALNFALEFLRKRDLLPKITYPGVFRCETGDLIFRRKGAKYYIITENDGVYGYVPGYLKEQDIETTSFIEQIGKTIFFHFPNCKAKIQELKDKQTEV